MKSPWSLFLFMVISLASFGQTQPGADTQVTGAKALSTDIDSVEQLQQFPDSVRSSYQRADSIRNNFNVTADSLQNEYKSAVAKIDDQINGVNATIDSLTRLGQPVDRHTKKLDSLLQYHEEVKTKFTSRLNDLKAKSTQNLDDLNLPAQYRKPVDQLTQKLSGAQIDTDLAHIPDINIPGYEKPSLNGTAGLTGSVGEISDLKEISGISNIETPAGELGRVTNEVQQYESDVKDLAKGNIRDAEQLPETLEQQASKIDGIGELQKGSGTIAEHEAKLEELNDPAKAKEKAVKEAKKAAINHFAGKEEQLKSAMEKISKYKQKYSSVSSIKDLPKRPPNAMKGKPLIERLVPGLSFQYQQKNSYLLDVNPYVGYKLSGRLTTGLGWNQRYAFGNGTRAFNARSRIFGPRAYVDFKIGKGFMAHVEGESMNSFVPSTLHRSPDSGNRQWVWSCMTGIKKEYKIYRNLKGTALIQYNLFNPDFKAPYVDRLNSRIGFEYMLKKKKRGAHAKSSS